MIIQTIQVVNEANHPVIWEVYVGDTPFSVAGRTYGMAIRKVPGAVTAGDVVMNCTVDVHRIVCVGDCSSLVAEDTYEFGLTENGVTILRGAVNVIERVA